MIDYSTSLVANGMYIELSSEYMGDMNPAWDPKNPHHSFLYVTANGNTQSFDVWGSMTHPHFDDEYSIRNIFMCVCDETLDVLWNDHEGLDEMSFEEAQRIINEKQRNASKMSALGLDEENVLLEIVNDESWR